MTAKWEKDEGNQGVLTVEVDAERLDQALDQAFKKVVKEVNIPGFRKGRVPRQVFEHRFGVEALYQDALDIILPEAYTEAVEETGIEPVDRPEVDIEQMEKGKTLIFTATVTVKPEVKLGQYKGLEVEEQDVVVTDEEFEAEMTRLQEGQAELVVIEEGEAQEGDTVVIDFDGYVNDEPFEGGKSENFSLELGSGQFIPGFEEQLIGEKPGAEKDVNVTFPEEYHAEELAGKEALFKVKVHDIKRKELPELDDEFAKDVDEEVDTLEELKTKVRTRLEENKKQQAEHAIQDAVVLQASENAEIDLPEVMIESEVERMVQEFAQRLQAQGMTLDMYYEFSGQDEAALQEQMKDEAEMRVRSSLTLEAIGKVENIEANDEDVAEEIKRMAEMYNMEEEQIKQAFGFEQDEAQEALKNDIVIRKTIEFLVAECKQVPKKEVEETEEEQAEEEQNEEEAEE